MATGTTKKLITLSNNSSNKANLIAAALTMFGKKTSAAKVIANHAEKGIDKEYNDVVAPIEHVFKKGTL